jgi:hypothetical protein
MLWLLVIFSFLGNTLVVASSDDYILVINSSGFVMNINFVPIPVPWLLMIISCFVQQLWLLVVISLSSAMHCCITQ